MTLGIGVTMTIGYGTLYYPFAILGPEVARDFGWSDSFVFGIFSVALLTSAFVAPLVGRMFDRFGPRKLLTIGSLLAALALTGLSQVSGKAGFITMLLLTESISCMVLYEAGFTALTAMHGLSARRHITHVTLVAGFASTIFWPLVHWLLGFMDWRGVFLILAAINILIALPIHALLPSKGQKTRKPSRATIGTGVGAGTGAMASQTTFEPNRAAGLLPPGTHRTPFILMALAFASSGFLMSSVHTSFFLLLESIGRSAALAAMAGAIIGPMQVGARLVELVTSDRVASSVVGLFSSAVLLAGLCLLTLAWVVAGPVPIILFAICFGIGQGLSFVARAVLPARLFGTEAYGKITGNLSGIRLVFTAAGPFLTAVAIDRFGAGGAFVMLMTMAVTGLASAGALVFVERRAIHGVDGQQQLDI